jgi:hypothetical protein
MKAAGRPRFQPRGWRIALATAALLAVAAAIRIRAAQNSLWLDEIVSVDLVRTLTSPLGVFTRIHSDNNHYLNSLLIYFLGFRGDWAGYRVPSILAGVGTVAVAGLIAGRRSASCALFAALLFSFSYVFVLYSSEARGYAELVFFSLLAYLLLGSYLDSLRWPLAVAFSLCACLGFLSHLSFAFFFLASLPWAAIRLAKGRAKIGGLIGRLAICYGAPALLAALLYLVDIRHMAFPGGAKPGLLGSFEAAMAWDLGMPFASTVWWMFAAAALVFASGLVLQWREEGDSAIFFAGMIVVAPLLLLFLSRQEVLYVRFFVVPMAFLLILLSRVLSRLWEAHGRAGRVVCCAFFAWYLAANAVPYLSLLVFGRGNNADAVQFLVRNARETPVTVVGDSDFRIGIVVDFFARAAPGGPSVTYFLAKNRPASGAEFIIREKESFEDPVPPATHLVDRAGNEYGLTAVFRTAPLSGLHWFIYQRQREGAPGGPPGA